MTFQRPIHLILPSLFSELKRPALKIISELNKINYVNEALLLDQANETEFTLRIILKV